MLPPGRPPLPHPDMPPELKELFDEVQKGRETLQESRREAVEDLPADASRGERRAALAKWYRQHAEDLARQEQREWELREMQALYMAANTPEDRVMPPEIQHKVEELRKVGRELLVARQEVLRQLGSMPSIREREQALERFRSEHQQQIEEIRERMADLKRWWQTEGSAWRGPRGLAERREVFAEEAQRWREEREQLRRDLEAAQSEDERAALIQAFREEQRAHFQMMFDEDREHRGQREHDD